MNRRQLLAGVLAAPVVAVLPEPAFHTGGYVDPTALVVLPDPHAAICGECGAGFDARLYGEHRKRCGRPPGADDRTGRRASGETVILCLGPIVARVSEHVPGSLAGKPVPKLGRRRT